MGSRRHPRLDPVGRGSGAARRGPAARRPALTSTATRCRRTPSPGSGRVRFPPRRGRARGGLLRGRQAPRRLERRPEHGGRLGREPPAGSSAKSGVPDPNDAAPRPTPVFLPRRQTALRHLRSGQTVAIYAWDVETGADVTDLPRHPARVRVPSICRMPERSFSIDVTEPVEDIKKKKKNASAGIGHHCAGGVPGPAGAARRSPPAGHVGCADGPGRGHRHATSWFSVRGRW